MPATEQTWRDQKILHVAFAGTSLLLLVGTLWMFADDHNREWKRYQRTGRRIETTLAEWKLQQAERDTSAKNTELQRTLVDLHAEPIPVSRLRDFAEEVFADAELRDVEPPDTSAIETPEAPRSTVLQQCEKLLQQARFREEYLSEQRKFKMAEGDAARANIDLAIRDGRSEDVTRPLQDIALRFKGEIQQLTERYQQAATHRKRLLELLNNMLAGQRELEQALASNDAERTRILGVLTQNQKTWGTRLLTSPVMDAFNSPLTIDNLWTEGLTLPVGSFGQVRRFDRCTTCHRAMDKTLPGAADQPAYVHQHQVHLSLATPESEPAPKEVDGEASNDATRLRDIYGFSLASEGLLNVKDVVVGTIEPGGLATAAVGLDDHDTVTPSENGLRVGDVIVMVNQDLVGTPQDVYRQLLQTISWGKPVSLTVRRGMPNPYTSHPRLDLFIGSLSPHPMATFGCTSCHDGQGSATAFKHASHTPSTVPQEKEWADQHGWFDNHYWLFPMQPHRFAESACLKCHHEVAELETSDRFPNSPAPKVTAGYHLIQNYGCYGCHEINGYKGPSDRIGPDMRLEPNYFAAAAQIRADGGFARLTDTQQNWIEQLAHHPERDADRRQLREFLLADAKADEPVLSSISHKLASVLQDVENPGSERKVGPSLRHVAGKVGRQFLYDWIRDPKNFRPSTKMPQFFGLHKHIDTDQERDNTARREAVEILGIVTYLTERSQPFDYLQPANGIADATADQRHERGKVIFETRCTACHSHGDFPNVKADFGPDLTGVGDKFRQADTPNAYAWMYSWIKAPNNYHARTRMPDLQLDPQTDAKGVTTDPVADLTEYLLAGSRGWMPAADVATQLTADPKTLDTMVFELLKGAFYEKDADVYIKQGIPPEMEASLKGAEVELLGPVEEKKKLLYVGTKAIARYGCYGCHDMPGFEDAKPIGTGLADWGRKDTSRLAFEHINEYLHHGHGAVDHPAEAHPAGAQHADHKADHLDPSHGATEAAESDVIEPVDQEYYEHQLEHHSRTGFIWQKLKEPRSYDFKKLDGKAYADRLRMPQFPLSQAEREQIITFVLGLVAEPPAPQFVYQPDAKQQAIVQGRKVLDRFNCAGCHILSGERWDLEFSPGAFEAPTASRDYPFVNPHATPEELAASKKQQPLRRTLRATIHGMPTLDDSRASPMVLDEEGDPIDLSSVNAAADEERTADDEEALPDPKTWQHVFDLWRPAVIEGNVFRVGVQPLTVPADRIRERFPAWGGDLTLRLLPRVTELERLANPSAKGSEAWAWLPPPLIGEGTKVQSQWLHDFLLDPYPIRPAVFLRMPKFNMSSAEATQLANFFAARDDAEYPYEFDGRTRSNHLQEAERRMMQARTKVGVSAQSEAGRLDQAMQIVTNANYCVKCHLVGDFAPAGADRAKAPNLADVQRRLRPDYLRDWIANPKSILPYTSMPVNIPYDPDHANLGGIDPKIYPGTSIDQVDALVDLLMNYDRYTRQRSPIAPLVKPAAGAAPPQAAAEPVPGQQKPPEPKNAADDADNDDLAKGIVPVGQPLTSRIIP